MAPPSSHLWHQLGWLLLLALPVACVARTVVFEEVFREPREYCVRKSKSCQKLLSRKFYYLFTCEYCFSHWVTLFFLIFTALGPGPGFRLLLDDWRGYVLAFFATVLVANVYLNIYSRIRLEIKRERVEIETMEHSENRRGVGERAGTPDLAPLQSRD